MGVVNVAYDEDGDNADDNDDDDDDGLTCHCLFILLQVTSSSNVIPPIRLL